MDLVALRKFGDENDEGESRLMDRYERISSEIQLSKAIQFGRSLSQPHMPTNTTTTTTISSYSTYSNNISSDNNNAPPVPPPPPSPFTTTTEEEDDVLRGRRLNMMGRSTSRHGLGGSFNKVFKKLLKPILWGKKSTTTNDHILHAAQQPQPPNHNHNLQPHPHLLEEIKQIFKGLTT